MKKLSSLLLVASFQLMAISFTNAQTGTWTAVTNPSPNDNFGVMLLMTDGTVICHNATGGQYGTGWDKLTPDATGSYVNGTWTTIASMNDDRIAFSSQVLPSGDVWVAGGEYGPGGNTSELYSPYTNTWTYSTGVPNGWNIYDAPSELLYNGKVLCGPEIGNNPSFDCLYFNPATNACSTAPSSIYNHDEAQWLKLPDSSVLFVGIGSQNSNRYIPQTGNWINDANVPVAIYDVYGEESGPAFMLPNGKAIFFGAAQYNAFYQPTGHQTNGTWTAAANFPTINGSLVGMPDAPGAMMVNGHILLAVSPIGTSMNDEFRTPTYFLEYDYTTNTFTQVTSPLPTTGNDSLQGVVSQQVTFLDLPDGNVLACVNQTISMSTQYLIYTPGSGPIPQGKPTINSILPDACPSYKITGKLFNGITEGAAFGDDWQMASNYPIVRLTNGTNVYYARTTNWNRVGAVQTDSLEDTCIFTLPSMPGGTYSLVVVANGNPSNPVLFNVFGSVPSAQTNVTCHGSTNGSASVSATGGISPYTYAWTPSGGTSASASNLSAGNYTVTTTDNNGCSTTVLITITQPTAIAITTTITDASPGNCNGAAKATPSGGTAPYTYSWSPSGTNDTIAGKCAGNYCCVVTDHNGCTQSSCVNIIVSAVQNIESDSPQISVYPNPSNGVFTVSITNYKLGITNMEIYNVLGQTVYSNLCTINNSQFTINLNQPNGIYFYRIMQANGSILGSGKLLIQK